MRKKWSSPVETCVKTEQLLQQPRVHRVYDDIGPVRLDPSTGLYLNWRIQPGYVLHMANGGKWLRVNVRHVHLYEINLTHPAESYHVFDLEYEDGRVDERFKLRDGDENVWDVTHRWAWRIVDTFRCEMALLDSGFRDLKHAMYHYVFWG